MDHDRTAQAAMHPYRSLDPAYGAQSDIGAATQPTVPLRAGLLRWPGGAAGFDSVAGWAVSNCLGAGVSG